MQARRRSRLESGLMCLAVPGQVIERQGDEATIDLQGSRLRVSTLLTPEVGAGDWVLVHAGFAITQLDEQEARETWDYLQQALGATSDEADPHDESPEAEGSGA